MPDWTYRPVFRPFLFRMPPTRARDLTLAAIGGLARAPFGGAVIEAFGHMRPPSSLRRTAMGIDWASPVGLGAGLDPAGTALLGLARFGFGFVEAGPVTVDPVAGPGPRRTGDQAIRYPRPLENRGAACLARRLSADRVSGRTGVRIGVRIAALPESSLPEATSQLRLLVHRFAPEADYLVLQLPGPLTDGASGNAPLEAALPALLDAVSSAAAEWRRPLLLCVSPDLPLALSEALLDAVDAAGLAGVLVGGGSTDVQGGRRVGAPTGEASLATVRRIADRWRERRGRLTLIGSGGVLAPGDALAMLQAGADLVQLHSGLVYSGPGLPKRINEALLWQADDRKEEADEVVPASVATAAPAPTWLGFVLLGLSMVIAGTAAWMVAATVVVLPYDLSFLGLDREAVAAIHPLLLPFMRHDRTSLAGTMISIGVLYTALSWFGVRKGVHWTRRALIASAVPGFASFFLFLAHGYFDPLHAVLSVLLLAMFLIGLCWPAAGPPEVPVPDLEDDRAYRLSLVGQLMAVILAAGLIVGGVSIAIVGSTRVFVPSDLAFIGRSAADLAAANPQLLPLIAHDRAGFGGALVADGIAMLTMALWGFRRGARWVWWAIALSGLPGLAAGIGVHATVGYLDFWHLSPALLALLLYVLTLVLSASFLGALSRPSFSAEAGGYGNHS